MNGKFGGGFRPRRFAPVKVGDELDVKIEAVGEKGDGIAKKEGFVLFVPGVNEGDEVRIRVTKVLHKVGFADVVGEPQGEIPKAEEPKPEAAEPEPQAEEEPEEKIEDTEDFGEELEEEKKEEIEEPEEEKPQEEKKPKEEPEPEEEPTEEPEEEKKKPEE